MKLTTENIEFINQYLIHSEIIYDDIKLELIDHIATDIETEMEAKKLPFEAVYEKCFDKMKPVLYKKNNHNPPLIIEEKAQSGFRQINIKSIIFSIICCLFLMWATIDIKYIFESIIFNATIYTLLTAYFSTNVYIKFKFYNNSYNEILIKSLDTVLVFAIYFILGTFKIFSNIKDIKMFLILGFYFYNISIMILTIFKNIFMINKLNQQKYETK